MKKLLLLGDSIRIGYQEFVKTKLEGKAEVVFPAENCAFSKFTLWYVQSWIGTLGTPDIIHWNNGIWDTHHIGNNYMGIFEPLPQYLDNLGRILKVLQRTGAKVIWASTTPVNEIEQNARINYNINAEIDEYNAAAAGYMNSKGIPVNDLNRLIAADPASLICEDGVHLTQGGSELCASVIADLFSKLA